MAKVVNLVTSVTAAGTALPPTYLDGDYRAGGAAITLLDTDNRAIVKLDTAAGTAVTLPAATGSGRKFTFIVTTVTTSAGAQTIATAPTTDVFVGVVYGTRVDSGNAVLGFAAGATDNKITLDHATKGGVSKGEYLIVEDIAAGIWFVSGLLTATGGAFATPFSHV